VKKSSNRLLLGLILVSTIALWWFFGSKTEEPHPVNEIYGAVERNEISKVNISVTNDRGQQYSVSYKDGQTRAYFVPNDSAKDLNDWLMETGVPVTIVSSAGMSKILDWIMAILPVAFLASLVIYSAKTSAKTQSLKDKLRTGGRSDITFKDVGGCEEAKRELVETVAHLRNPERLKRLGGKPPKGVLLIGPPGSGKTLLARAVAGEAGVPFFSISGSEFTETFVGVGAARVRALFEEAKKHMPCIIFIDEIDAVGQARKDKGSSGGDQEREQTLNQLLVEMDGFEGIVGIIVLAATNRPDSLDSALSRPGRFDRTVTVSLPDIRDRKCILETTVQSRSAPLGEDVDLSRIARSTSGFSGADLANLVIEAALHAARLDRDALQAQDFDAARDRVIMGLKNERVMSDDERRVIATHEAGHALVAYHLRESDPIYKVTIVSRGDAMGMLTRLPDADRFTVSRRRLIADMAVALGGRLAEEKVGEPDDVTSGAANDLDKVTAIAQQMVTAWGFLAQNDGCIGYRTYLRSDHCDLSNSQIERAQKEVDALIEEARGHASLIINQHSDQLKLLAEELLERETLTLEDIRALLAPTTPALS